MVIIGDEAARLERHGSEAAELSGGRLIGHRYRILEPVGRGWRAYDERLRRPVFVEPIREGGDTPEQRIRSEAARGRTLLDAVVCRDTAFAVRICPPSRNDSSGRRSADMGPPHTSPPTVRRGDST